MSMVVACAGYENGRRIADLDLASSGSFARGPGRFVWIGLHEPIEEYLKILQHQFGLHELAIEDAFRAHQRPKIDVFEESVFIVLRTAQLIGDEIAFGETHLFAGRGYVISVRHGASASYKPVRERCEGLPKLLGHGEDFVIYAIIDFVVDNYIPIVDAIEDKVQEIEDMIHAGDIRQESIHKIAVLRRDLMQLRRTTAPMLEVCGRLQRFDMPFIDAVIHPYYADVYDHLIHVNESIDILRDMLTAAFETNFLLTASRQNEIMRQLAGWAAILAVPTAVAGIYGMNFEHMPELHALWGYPLVLLAIAAICVGLFIKFRRMGWL